MSPERPDWWSKNDRLREELGLPDYEPSRLSDGTYVHELIEDLEATYDCEIRLESTEATYPSRWNVVVDGTACATTKRRRDQRGNNVYGLSSDEFREQVREAATRS